MVNLGKRLGVSDVDNRGFVSTAEASTLQLEFKYLSLLTDEEAYWEKAEKVSVVGDLWIIAVMGLNNNNKIMLLGHGGYQGFTSNDGTCIHLHEVRL